MTREEAIKALKENYCAMCAYGSQNMDSCDIRSCDNRDAIKALEQAPTTKNDLGVDSTRGFTTTCRWDYCPNCGAKMESEE